MRPTFRVSCKAALFNPSRTKVLIVEYDRDYSDKEYGLPGGHMEKGESPDETITREIKEETGLNLISEELQRRDFWLHGDGKVILGYVGEVSDTAPLAPGQNEIKNIVWVDANDIKSKKYELRDFADFVVSNCSVG